MAAKKVIWSANAQNSLIDILSYWIEENGNKKYSLKLYDDFKKIERIISHFPNIGKQTDRKDVRNYIKLNFSVYYQEIDNMIRIINVWDNRRNPDDFRL